LISPPAEPFRVDVVRTDGDLLITPYGELDLATAPALQQVADGLDLRTVRRVVVDLRNLDFIDSTGVVLMHHLSTLMRTSQTLVFFVRGPLPIQRVFQRTGLDQAVAFVDVP
jgi:anti-sigma B factor antagonist